MLKCTHVLTWSELGKIDSNSKSPSRSNLVDFNLLRLCCIPSLFVTRELIHHWKLSPLVKQRGIFNHLLSYPSIQKKLQPVSCCRIVDLVASGGLKYHWFSWTKMLGNLYRLLQDGLISRKRSLRLQQWWCSTSCLFTPSAEYNSLQVERSGLLADLPASHADGTAGTSYCEGWVRLKPPLCNFRSESWLREMELVTQPQHGFSSARLR